MQWPPSRNGSPASMRTVIGTPIRKLVAGVRSTMRGPDWLPSSQLGVEVLPQAMQSIVIELSTDSSPPFQTTKLRYEPNGTAAKFNEIVSGPSSWLSVPPCTWSMHMPGASGVKVSKAAIGTSTVVSLAETIAISQPSLNCADGPSSLLIQLYLNVTPVAPSGTITRISETWNGTGRAIGLGPY